MEPAIDRLLDIYGVAMTAPPGAGDASRAAAIHCCRIAQPLKRSYDLGVRAESLAQLLGECERDLVSTRAEVQALSEEVDAFKALPTLRLRDVVLKAPVVGPAIQAGARRFAKLLSR
jgi:hypothetical protein